MKIIIVVQYFLLEGKGGEVLREGKIADKILIKQLFHSCRQLLQHEAKSRREQTTILTVRLNNLLPCFVALVEREREEENFI